MSLYSDDLHCPYPNCHLLCRSIAVHRAKFAAMYYRKRKKPSSTTPNHTKTNPITKSPRINYQVAAEILGANQQTHADTSNANNNDNNSNNCNSTVFINEIIQKIISNVS
jgi:hypothetical protein